MSGPSWLECQDKGEYLVCRWRGGWLWHLDDSRSGVEMLT